jgi:hypothetical protein
VIDTPTTKTGAKRSSNSIDSVADDGGEAGQTSVTKPTKVRVSLLKMLVLSTVSCFFTWTIVRLSIEGYFEGWFKDIDQ